MEGYASREEYYQAYPKADDDGWVEWTSDDLPVKKGTIIDVKYSDGDELHGAPCGEFTTNGMSVMGERASAEAFGLGDGSFVHIVAYRLHKPEVKSEFCESVMRSIPDPATKPTIEQLAQDYRNAKEYAERLQRDADEAKDKSEEIKELLIKSGAEIGVVISIWKAGDEIEYKIGDKWFLVSDLKSAGWTDEQLSDYPSR